MNWIAASPFIAGLLILVAGLPLQSRIASQQAKAIRTSLGRAADPVPDDFASQEIPDKVGDGMDRMQAFASIITTTPALVFGLALDHLALFWITVVGYLALIYIVVARVRPVPRSWHVPFRLTWHTVGTAAFLLGATVAALLTQNA